MTLPEAIELMEELHFENVGSWGERWSDALKLVIEAAKKQAGEETVEIPAVVIEGREQS